MKALKILLSITALVIIVLILSVGALIYFADPNKIKPVLVEEVAKKTGYQLKIEGKLSWTLYPRFAIRSEHLLLSVPGQSVPFMDAQDVRIAADLLDILQSREKLTGNVTIASIRLMNIQAANVSASLGWEKNILTISPIKASLYGGQLEGAASGRRFDAAPLWRWNVQTDNIQVKPLLEDVNGKKTRLSISGVGQMKMQAETSGKSHDRMIDNLNGTVSFNLNDGVVEGVDLNYLLKSADALLNKGDVKPPENIKQTEFRHLSGTAVINQGVAVSNDIMLTAPDFTAKAQGEMKIISRELDMKLQIKPSESARTQWEIPVLLTGDLSHPNVKLDSDEIQKFLAAQEIDKLKEKASEQIKKHIPGKAGEFLQNLLR